jgi:mono/diheme cytochrome c family protein
VIRRWKPFSSSLLLGLIALLAVPTQLSASKKNEDEKAGAVLFRDKGCTYCHGVGGVGTKKAPSVTELYKDKTWTPEKITSQILNGGQKMPPFRDSVTDDEVIQLIAYLRAKVKPVPPPAVSPDANPAPNPQ